jgi:hypothetical protein
MSYSNSMGGNLEFGAVQWKAAMLLCRRDGGKEVHSDTAQFVSVIVFGVAELFAGSHDNAKRQIWTSAYNIPARAD